MTAFDPASFDIPRAQNEALLLRPPEEPKSEVTTVARDQCHTNIGGPIKALLQRSIDRSQI